MSKMTVWATTVGGKLAARANKPKVLVTASDDISDWLISAYVRGLMGDDALNGDRIGDEGEGMIYTEAYRWRPRADGRRA